MNESLLKRIMGDYRKRRGLAAVILCLSVIVAVGTFAVLRRNAQAKIYTTRILECPYMEPDAEPVAHIHNDDCYDAIGNRVCTLPEIEAHRHGDECYEERSTLVCGLEENPGHQHTDACYTEERSLVCGLEENPGHQHTDACYTEETSLVCGLEETPGHQHTDSCYTLERGELICSSEDEEHEHTDDCYAWEEVLTCGMEEGEGAHWHDGSCYETERVLTCGMEEGEGAHWHDGSCYETERVLTCGMEEGEGAHQHDESCYGTERVLICDKPELEVHVHDANCFRTAELNREDESEKDLPEKPVGDPYADLQSASDWERDFENLELSGNWGRDLVAVASTQLGESESSRNFEAVLNRSKTNWIRNGYTRYGAWYGDPYGEWSAMFVSFCLRYAGIPTENVPNNPTPALMARSFISGGLYAGRDYMPAVGDLIFFDTDREEGIDHMGIVRSADAAGGRVSTIEGDRSDCVDSFEYDLNDDEIVGYGMLPQNPEEPAAAEPEAPAVTDGTEMPSAAEENGQTEGTEPTEENEQAEEPDQTGDEEPEQAEEAEPTPAVPMPAQSWEAFAGGIRVSVEAPEGAFPENTTMSVAPVNGSELKSTVSDAVNGDVLEVQAVDIKFFSAEGQEIEPATAIRVSMTPVQSRYAEERTSVVHIDNDGEATKIVQADGTEDDSSQVVFDADAFTIYAIVYTNQVGFEYEVDGEVYTSSVAGAQDAQLSDVIRALGIVTEEEVPEFVSKIVRVSCTDAEAVRVTETENDWLIRPVKNTVQPESLIITMQDDARFDIQIAAQGITELSVENATISTVNDLYLPEDASAYAELLTDTASENAIAAVQAAEESARADDPDVAETGAAEASESAAADPPAAAETAYRVFDIGLNDVDVEEYEEGFQVEVTLPENVVGSDFRLYHIHEGEVKEIGVELQASETQGGSQLVRGFRFTTDCFSEFVLKYTVDFEYTDEDGNVRSWSFPGLGSYPVSYILEQAGIEAAVTEKAELVLGEAVGETDDRALYLEEKDDGWYLTSEVAFDDTYYLTVTADGKAYRFVVTDSQFAYEIIFRFYDENGQSIRPTGVGQTLTVFAKDPAPNNYQAVKNYYYCAENLFSAGTWQQNSNGDWELGLSISSFWIENGNPTDHAYQSGDDVTVDLLVSANGPNSVDRNEGRPLFQSDNPYSTVTDGALACGYAFEIMTDREQGQTVYTASKPQPYRYTIRESSNPPQALSFDEEYQSNWYLLSKLTKAGGAGIYYCVIPVNLAGYDQVSGEISRYYVNEDLKKISLNNPGSDYNTSSSVYVPGDTVTTYLVHMKHPANNYQEVIQPNEGEQHRGEMYGNGGGANRYTLVVDELLTDSENRKYSSLILERAAIPTVTVSFVGEDGSETAPFLTGSGYYLYVELNRGSGETRYGYVSEQTLDLTQATKEYTIPFFTGSTPATAEDHAYLTDGRSYTAYIVKKNNGRPSVEMCRNRTGVLVYDERDQFDAAVLDNSNATSVGTIPSPPNGIVKIKKLPNLSVTTAFYDEANSPISSPTDISGVCHLLIRITTEAGDSCYQLVPVDPSSAAAVPLGTFRTKGDNGKEYYYTGKESISVSVVQSGNPSLSLQDAIQGNGCYLFENGAVTSDGYKIEAALEPDDDGVLTVNLKKQPVVPSALTVTGEFYPNKGDTTVMSPLPSDHQLSGSYYLLTCLKSGDQIVAYHVDPISADGVNSSGSFSVSLPATTAYRMVDAKEKEIWPISGGTQPTLQYDPSLYSITVRLFEGNNTGTYLEAKAGNDTIEGYDFWETITGPDSATIKLHSAYRKIYQVQVCFSEAPDIAPGNELGIKVEAAHATTGTDIYSGSIAGSGSEWSDGGTKWTKVIEDQTASQKLWTQPANGGNNIFSGNEKVTITLSRGSRSIPEGGLAYDYFVRYDSPDRTVVPDNDEKTTVITDYVTLEKVFVTHDYDFFSILGEGVGYGITADEIYQNGHIQSNFATNFYYGNNIIEPNLAGNKGAVIVIADFDLREGKALEIGGDHPENTKTIIYLGNGGTRSLVRNVEQRDWVYVIPSDSQDLTDNMVNPILQHGSSMSNELLTHEATIHPTPNEEGKMYINLLDFPEDATIYLDGDELAPWIAKGSTDGLYITKHKEQMIVFNFEEPNAVALGQYHVMYADSSEDSRFNPATNTYFHTHSPQGKGSPDNAFADELAQHVVFNLNKAEYISVEETIGMILAPRSGCHMNVEHTSAGWIICGGKVTNNSGAEWHSVYAQMPDSDTTDLTVFKTVDGNTPDEHQKFYFTLDHLVTTDGRQWVTLRSEVQNDSRAVKFNGITEMEHGWNVYRISESADPVPGTGGNYKQDSRNIYAFVRYYAVGDDIWAAGSPRYYISTVEGEASEFIFNKDSFDRNADTLTAAVGSNSEGEALRPTSSTSLGPTFENQTRHEGLEIVKTVPGEDQAAADGQIFKFRVTFTKNGSAFPCEVKVTDRTRSSEYVQTDDQGRLEVSVQYASDAEAAGKAVLTEIPEGVNYTVEEYDNPEGWKQYGDTLYSDGETDPSAVPTINPGDTDTVTVTNVRVGALKITKIVTINGSTVSASSAQASRTDGNYTFQIYETLNGSVTEIPAKYADGTEIPAQTITYTGGVADPAGGSVLAENLRPGTYVVKETGSANADMTLVNAARGDGETTAVTEAKTVIVQVEAGNTAEIETGHSAAEAIFTNDLEQIDIKIIKVDPNKTGDQERTLAGARFKILKKTGSTYQTYPIPGVTDAVTAEFPIDEAGEAVGIPKTGFTLTLPAGDYEISEVRAPDGYLITEGATFRFGIENGEITAENGTELTLNQNLTLLVKYIQAPDLDSSEQAVFEVGNQPGVELPATGGTGTVLYTALGALLTGTAGAALMLRRRKKTV